jgi:hypothetical protein
VSRQSTVAVALLLVTLLQASAGCTLIGTGIGSAFSRYENVASPPHLDEAPPTAPPSYGDQAPPIAPPSYKIAVEPGEELKVVRASDHREFSGIFGGIRGDELVLVGDGRTRYVWRTMPVLAAIKVTDIELIRVRRGSYWATGTVVGAVLDTIAIVSVVALFYTSLTKN